MYIKYIPDRVLDDDYKIKFLKKIDIPKDKNECFIWLGAKVPDLSGNYRPYIKLNNISYYASRVLYYMIYHIDPGELYVLHTCDEPMCMNPKHLFLGTLEDNMRDRADKGRYNNHGENNPNNKLTEQDVIAIREKYSTGKYTQEELASEYNVNRSMINHIISGRNWRTVG